MEIVKKMRFIKGEQRHTDKGDFNLCQFLDENDDKYTFFVGEEFYNKVKNLKKYDLVDVKLNLYSTNKGRYGLGVM